ncbi:hypothetical protein [Stenotrophomonas cyclobalanopsidis]|uniref:hypothetical protein n=1 Tax=Stenotrophomonas cyclobalanopsidis TaxID=2771362 RepID=UPI0028B04659|nr:hypothetical protein [Stenotrophomonas cyclobalanopsidis]
MKNKTPPEGRVFVCGAIAVHARIAWTCPNAGHEKTRFRGFDHPVDPRHAWMEPSHSRSSRTPDMKKPAFAGLIIF